MARDDGGMPIVDLYYKLAAEHGVVGKLQRHDHSKYGVTYTGVAFWRNGDNRDAISLVPSENKFNDFSNGDGHLHGRWELVAAAKGIQNEQAAGELFRKQYSNGQEGGKFTQFSEQEIGSAKKWIDGMREYSGDRLEAMKLALQRVGDIPEEDQRLIRNWTDYGDRLKSIQRHKTDTSTGSRYTAESLQLLIEAYRQHAEKHPKWAAEMVDRGQEIFEERMMLQRSWQVAQPKHSVLETEKNQRHSYSQSGFGVG